MKIELPLSVSIIAKNEEENLKRCLGSLRGISSEVLLVYNDCSDGTVRVAENFGVICLEQPWLGYRNQKNFALSKCTNDWVLCLDADEHLTEELHSKIYEFLNSTLVSKYNGASFNRCSYFMGKWIRHGDWYPDRKTRLVKRAYSDWKGGALHEYLDVAGETLTLKGDLLHNSYGSVCDFPVKALKYAEIFVMNEKRMGRKIKKSDIWTRPLWRFFRSYFLRFGFLDGVAGFFISLSTAYETMIRYGLLSEEEMK